MHHFIDLVIFFHSGKSFLSVVICWKFEFVEVRCLFSTFLSLQGDQHCSCAQTWCHFVYCKSRILRMHVIFVYFVRDGLRTKIVCIRKVQSKSENPHRSVTLRNFHACVRSESLGIRKFSAYEIFWIYSMFQRAFKQKNIKGLWPKWLR